MKEEEIRMTNEEAHRILSNGLVNAPSEHKWCTAFHKAVKALEQEPILDKIRAEIVELDNKVCQQFLIEDADKEIHHAYQDCLAIIDKYNEGSGVTTND